MASIFKERSKWRVQIRRDGVSESATFPTKAHAQAWAAQKEVEYQSGRVGKYPSKTLGDALTRYGLEVTPKKEGADWERKRLTAFARDFPGLCKKVLHTVDSNDIASWRDKRLEAVKGSTVVRESSIYRDLWNVARREWGWCGASPWDDVKMPGEGPARDRIPTWREIKAILRWLGYTTGCEPDTMMRQAAYCYLIALHTAMRAQEVRGLSVETVNIIERVITLNTHKTEKKTGRRLVPYFPRANRIFKHLKASSSGPFFSISAGSLDALFRKAKANCGIDGVTFHDSRAFALTWMAKKIDVMRLSKISGHRDIKLLVNTYYRATAAEIAKGL